jgi:hypothetical protein
MTGRLAQRAAAFAVAALVAAGCASSTDNPTVLESPTSTATASSSALGSPTPTADITSGTPESAIAFTRYYFDVLSYAYRTGDDGLLKMLSDDSCQTCAYYSARIASVYGAGGHISGGQLTVLDASVTGDAPTDASEVPVNVLASSAEYSEVDASGTVQVTEPAVEEFGARVTLSRSMEAWKVARVQSLKAG